MLRVIVLFAALLVGQAMAVDFVLQLVPGWNLVSVPIAPVDPRPDAVFQGMTQSTVWEYDPDLGCYAEAEQIQPGRGYWVYTPVQPGHATDPLPPLTVTGSVVRSSIVPLSAGWALLGPISYDPYPALPAPLKVEPGGRSSAVPIWVWRNLRYYKADSLPCGAGAWVYTATACDVNISPNPTFAGALMAYSPDPGEACVHWPEAVDDRTAAEQMLYRVYAAPTGRAGLVDGANLACTVTGTTQASLAGLTPGETYDIAVVAEDEVGNRNYFNRTELTVSVMEVENVLAKTPRDLAAEGIEAVGVSPDGSVVTVGDAGALAVGDLIVFDNANGQGLKRIVAVNRTREGVNLTTVDACLAEAIDTGVLRSSLVVGDMDGLVPASATRNGTQVYQDPAGAFRLTRQVVGEQGVSRDETGVVGGRYEGEADLGSGLSVGYGIGFKPTIDTEARFESLSLKYCRIVATGELGLDAWAKYDLAGKLGLNPKKKLFSVSHSFYYQVGYLPVWQDVGLDFYAEMEVTAAGALNMEAAYSASKTVQIGVEYDDGTWRTVTSDGFTQSVTFDVSAEGTLLATVKIYPVLWTKFYSSLAASLYVQPTLQLDSEVRLLPLPVETTRFDVDFLVDSRVEASIEILGWGKTWTSPTWTMLDVPLSSLPEIAFEDPPSTMGTNQPTTFTLAVTDGVNNPVPPANIKWWVESIPERRGTLPTILPSADRLSATVTAMEPGEYCLWASAYGSGMLGALGKRYALAVFEVSPSGEYMVIDVSAGASARTYPVSYLAAVPAGGWTEEYKTNRLVMRRIPAGTFTMGSPAGELGRFDDETQHKVTLTKDFYIGVFEVTQRQWERVMGEWPLSVFSNTNVRSTRPVDYSTYDEIRGRSAGACWPMDSAVDGASFIGKLRQKTGLATLDLPTESQWEYACRSGKGTALNSGRNLTDTQSCPNVAQVARYYYSGGGNPTEDLSGGTAAVGSYLPNSWGLYDMHGNVWEWCLDWYGVYPGTATNPEGAHSGERRMLRGGGYFNQAMRCRSAVRSAISPNYLHGDNGLRLVRTVP